MNMNAPDPVQRRACAQNLALHFVAKVFSSPTPNSRNVYALLAEYLGLQFQTRRSAQLPALADGLDLQRPELVRLLKAVRSRRPLSALLLPSLPTCSALFWRPLPLPCHLTVPYAISIFVPYSFVRSH